MTGTAAGTKQKALAPGARVEIRDEEWIVRSVKGATFGGQAVHVVGTSELVRNKEAIFLTELDTVTELLPEETIGEATAHERGIARTTYRRTAREGDAGWSVIALPARFKSAPAAQLARERLGWRG